MERDAKIYVAGHRGMVGSAIVRRLQAEGYRRLVVRTSQELDLRDGAAVRALFDAERPDYVFLAAAKVGGIWANYTAPAEFIYDDLSIQTNVIHESYRHGVRKLLFLGSSCIYPRDCPQPIKEEYLLTGPLEPTNAPYAVAKIAGIVMCQSYNRQYGTRFISAMPTNLYGPGDNFDFETAHVLPTLIRKFHEATIAGKREVVVWGTGNPRREFLHVDDQADACLFLMRHYEASEPINVGVGEDISIRDLASLIGTVVGFEGAIVWDPTKPDGTPRKLLDVSRLHAMGWKAHTRLREGVERTYAWFGSAGVSGVLRGCERVRAQ
ncbi:MAG: GDP-L-fucose synthase family protein [Nitrospirota bacterium]